MGYFFSPYHPSLQAIFLTSPMVVKFGSKLKEQEPRYRWPKLSLLRRVAECSLRSRVRNSVTWEDLRLELLLLHIESSQLTLLRHLYRMPPERLLLEVFSGDPPGRRPNRRPRTLWSDSLTRLAWDIKIHFAPVATFSDENL